MNIAERTSLENTRNQSKYWDDVKARYSGKRCWTHSHFVLLVKTKSPLYHSPCPAQLSVLSERLTLDPLNGHRSQCGHLFHTDARRSLGELYSTFVWRNTRFFFFPKGRANPTLGLADTPPYSVSPPKKMKNRRWDADTLAGQYRQRNQISLKYSFLCQYVLKQTFAGTFKRGWSAENRPLLIHWARLCRIENKLALLYLKDRTKAAGTQFLTALICLRIFSSGFLSQYTQETGGKEGGRKGGGMEEGREEEHAGSNTNQLHSVNQHRF